MSLDLLNRLAAAGTPMDLIMEVAETLADARSAQRLLDQRREKDRLRKRTVSVESVEKTEIAESVETPSPLVPPKVSPKPPSNNPPISPIPTQIGVRAWACPDGVDAGHWADFRKNRRTKRLTDSETAYQGQLKALSTIADDEWPPGRLVQFAAEKGWGSINDPRTSTNGIGHGRLPQHGLRGTRPDPALDLYRTACAAEERENREVDRGAGIALPSHRTG